MLTIKQIDIIDDKKFLKVALNENSETFVIYVMAVEALLLGLSIYLDRKA